MNSSSHIRAGVIGAGLREDLEAIILALAAQQSSTLGAPVEVAPLRKRIFNRNL